MADNAPALMWINGPGGCEFVNREYLAFLGVTLQDVVGYEWAYFVHPEDRAHYVGAYLHARAERGLFEATCRMRRYDGVYRSMKSIGMPRYSDDGAFLGYVGSTIDVTDVYEALDRKVEESQAYAAQARQQADEARAWLAAIVDSSNDAIVSKDLRGVVTSWNAGAERLFGYTAAEMIGRPITAIIPPDHLHEEQTILTRVLHGQRVDHYETVRMRKDGSRIHISLAVSPVKNSDGRVIGASKVARDISARKKMEEALSAAEERARTVLQATTAVMYQMDADNRFVLVNRRFEELFGMTSEELKGKSVFDVFPEDTAAVFETHNRMVFVERRALEFEETAPQADGLHWYSSIKAPLFNEQGEVVGIVGVSTDITARKRMEAALRESETRFRQLGNSVPQLVWTCGADGSCDFLSAQWVRYTGKDESAQLGFNWLEQIHPDDRERTLKEWQAAVHEQREFRVEFRIRRHDGEYRMFDTRACPVCDAGGQIVRWVGTNTDITERKQQEDELRRLKDALEVRVQERTQELVASQERLRALTAQLTVAEQRERQKLSRDLHDYLAQLLVVGSMKMGSAKRQPGLTPSTVAVLQDADKMFHQALSYTRTLISDLSPPSFHEYGLMSALKWFTERIEKDGLTVDVQANAQDIPLTEEQAVMVFQCVRELLFNVLKHAGVDRAAVRCAVEEHEVRVSVADSGRGMDADEMQRPQKPGHLGLGSVRERMESLNGRVDVVSDSGKGTTVTLVLPRSPRVRL